MESLPLWKPKPSSPGVLAELNGNASGLIPVPDATVPRGPARLVPKPNPPSRKTPFRLMPSCLVTERCTSTTETLSATCSSPVMVRRLTMPGPEPAAKVDVLVAEDPAAPPADVPLDTESGE